MQVGLGLLGLEDAARAPSRWASSPSSPRRPDDLGRLARAPRAAPALGARLPRRAGRARVPRARGRRLPQHARPPTSSSTGRKPSYLGGHPRDGQPPPLRLLGRPHRGPAHRAACRTRPRAATCRSSRRSTPTPARLREFLAAMTGLSHPANVAIAERFPWGGYSTFVDVGTAQGDLAVQIALANPHLTGGGLRPARGRPDLRGLRRASNGLAERLALRRRGLLRRRAARRPTSSTMGHILHDWDLDAEADADRQGVRRAARGRRADRLRGDHRRRPLARTRSAC